MHSVTRQPALLEVYSIPERTAHGYLARMRELQDRVSRVDDPGALQIHDVGVLCDSHPYVVREALDGTTLAEVVADSRLSVRDAVDLVDEILDVLIAAHAAGVVHGALNLDRVLIAENEQEGVKLLDWGIAQAIVGNTDISFADDIYALGQIFDRLLPVVRPSGLQSLVAQMLAGVPAARPSIGEVARRLALADDVVVPSLAAAQDLPHDFPRVPRHLTWPGWRATTYAAAMVAPIIYLMVRIPETGERRGHATAAMVSVASAEPSAASTPSPIPAVQPPPPQVPPTAIARPSSATPVTPAMKTVKKRPHEPRIDARDTSERTIDRDLLRRYQRVGHDLINLQGAIGYTGTSQLTAEFRSIDIHAAMATPRARQEASVVLSNLERALERNRPVELSDACRNNPLATDCQ